MIYTTFFVIAWLACFGAASATQQKLTFSQVGPHKTVKRDNVDYYETHFLSSHVHLDYGSIVNNYDETIFPLPSGDIDIYGFHSSLVDADLREVPLNEVYLHHWLLFLPDPVGPCAENLGFTFGGGAESRGAPFQLKYPYGIPVTDDITKRGMVSNLHVLRTEKLDPRYSVQNCIECLYAPGKGDNCIEEVTGTFECCNTDNHCPLEANAGSDVKKYFVKYTVQWRPHEADKVVPVTCMVLDAAECNVIYNVEPNPTGYDILTYDQAFEEEWYLIFAQGHQHVGGVNITLTHTESNQFLCPGVAEYGTSQTNEPGNELGYLVAMDACDFTDNPVRIQEGHHLTLSSTYKVGEDPRVLQPTNGMHGGVMSLYISYFTKSVATDFTASPLPTIQQPDLITAPSHGNNGEEEEDGEEDGDEGEEEEEEDELSGRQMFAITLTTLSFLGLCCFMFAYTMYSYKRQQTQIQQNNIVSSPLDELPERVDLDDLDDD